MQSFSDIIVRHRIASGIRDSKFNDSEIFADAVRRHEVAFSFNNQKHTRRDFSTCE